MFAQEVKTHLEEKLLPFWESMADREYGGFYGYLGYDLQMDRHAVKGVILNSRILWFFSNSAAVLERPELLAYADHAYQFLRDYCVDKVYGGVFWSMTYDGELEDETKHTYNQAFAIYALSSYYAASGEKEALKLAYDLFRLIESRCRDEAGYGEAYTRNLSPAVNDKLSENGVTASKTMNTLLHVFEAYTELYWVDRKPEVGEKLREILDVFGEKVYNPQLKRQEVFFDNKWESLIDLHSYGHDIETSWLIDWGLEVLDDPVYTAKMKPVVNALAKEVYERAYQNRSLMNECENGVDDTDRIWWVQAEAVVGFYNAWERDPSAAHYLKAAETIWSFIQEKLVDSRPHSEWFWRLHEDGTPVEGEPIVEPWKCPYHNGRMCMEIWSRSKAKNANQNKSK